MTAPVTLTSGMLLPAARSTRAPMSASTAPLTVASDETPLTAATRPSVFGDEEAVATSGPDALTVRLEPAETSPAS